MNKTESINFPDGLIYRLLQFISTHYFENPVSIDELKVGLKYRNIDADDNLILDAIKYLRSSGLIIYGDEIVGFYRRDP